MRVRYRTRCGFALCGPFSLQLSASPARVDAHLGAMAQLVARFHGMEEVGGSNPPSSTICLERQFSAVSHLGAMAQLVARFHGMEEVGGSNPPSSTITKAQACEPGLSSCWRACGFRAHGAVVPEAAAPAAVVPAAVPVPVSAAGRPGAQGAPVGRFGDWYVRG